jgi:hypothetical protein
MSLLNNENQELVIAISTDQLFIVKTDGFVTDPKNELSMLLDGKDNMLSVISGPSESIFSLIDECYTARERGNQITIKTASQLISFK